MDAGLSTTSSRGEPRALLLAQVREAYGRICYTHKTQEKQADICHEKYRKQRRVRVGLTAVSSGAFLASLTGLLLDKQWAAVVTSFIAVLLSASALSDKTFQHGEEMQQHRETAAKLWNVRESYLSLLVDLTSGSITLEEGRGERDKLQVAAGAIYADAPRTSAAAYKRAQEALQMHGDLTFSSAEIDQLLPPALRTGQAVADVASE
ncbi:SLATT domain-containing protein [Cellulosimicrobium composti]|uniref:SLATT domain-containing protein n=1 Tax=Cellulosimicrobium composti TaxID=2672572 RepID=A0ABX0BIY5_9MICO|nr:SLATT domain-containing protein [Cellulosimicrobium composti]NDO91490.1 SLATT domain-containing protein [Cellulosimicrobium composti]